MALFRTVSFNEIIPGITGAGVILRAPHSGDFAEWAALRAASRNFLVPWEPTWPSDDLSRGAFRRRLKRYAEDQRSDLAYAFLIFRSEDNAMVGGLTLANIRRGVAQAGSIGYWVGERFARKGYMLPTQPMVPRLPPKRMIKPAKTFSVICPASILANNRTLCEIGRDTNDRISIATISGRM